MADVMFSFDPACPWTWRASRWLSDVAEARGLDIEWRACSLAVLNKGGEVPDEWKAPVAAAGAALRLIEALRRDGRQADIARFYAELGSRTHDIDERLSAEAVRFAAEAAGLSGDLAALDDTTLDAAVEASTDAAMAAAGPGVGSPVVQLPDVERGLYGPILDAVPDKKDGQALWDAVETLVRMPAFAELKRGRP